MPYADPKDQSQDGCKDLIFYLLCPWGWQEEQDLHPAASCRALELPQPLLPLQPHPLLSAPAAPGLVLGEAGAVAPAPGTGLWGALRCLVSRDVSWARSQPRGGT